MPQVELQIEQLGGIRLLTLSRPERLNALNGSLRDAVVDALAKAAADDGTRCVILTGAGERAFCAGQDLNESAALDGAESAEWMAGWQRYFAGLASFPKPMVAAVNGVAAGAGFQTALLADLRVAVPAARFIMAEIDAGLPAIVGGHLLTLHLGHGRARELVLTGRAMPFEEALAAGLVHGGAEPRRLLDEALRLARRLAAKPPTAMRLTLGKFRRDIAAGMAEAEAAATRYQVEAMKSGDPQRMMMRFLQRRRHGGSVPT